MYLSFGDFFSIQLAEQIWNIYYGRIRFHQLHFSENQLFPELDFYLKLSMRNDLTLTNIYLILVGKIIEFLNKNFANTPLEDLSSVWHFGLFAQ